MDEGDDPYLGAHNELTKLALVNCLLQTLDIEICLLQDHERFMLPQIWDKLDALSNFATLHEVALVVCISGVPTQEEADILVNQLSEVLQVAFAALSNEPRMKFHFAVQKSGNTQPRSPLYT